MTDKLNKKQIIDLLPHREPMLLIDELIPSFNELELYYKHMRARIEEYIASPPASDWEGVYVAKNK